MSLVVYAAAQMDAWGCWMSRIVLHKQELARFPKHMFTAVPAGADRVIARVEKESRFASSTAFLMNAMTDAQKYFVHIEPGVDAAFIVALATLCDEIFHDQK